jgi:putative membrane protein
MRHLKGFLLLFLKGMSMGAADIVPGVSGGSIALITGIYEKLLDSIKSIDRQALGYLFKLEFKLLWSHINGNFLLTLFLGILTSIFTLSKLITYLLEFHPIPLWSFFCGLIIISAIIILRDIKNWTFGVVLAIILGTISAFYITGLPPIGSPDALWFTFIAGAIAICAMILPGISGSFLLLIMGQYERILAAVSDKNIPVLALFALGCIVGLLSFSRLISWLLKKHHALTIGLLSGFMLGSINKLWPWKEVISYRMSSSGAQKPFVTENILPQNYLEVTGQDSLFLFALLAFSFGVILVLGIERTAYYINRK